LLISYRTTSGTVAAAGAEAAVRCESSALEDRGLGGGDVAIVTQAADHGLEPVEFVAAAVVDYLMVSVRGLLCSL
jgi:hypothetical protein